MYKPINGYTKEKIINVIKKRMKSQPCYDTKAGICRYENSNGNHCAVGAFLPKGKHMKLEGDVTYLLRCFPELKNHLPLKPEAMLVLQNLHDTDCNNGNFKDRRPKLIEWIKNFVK